MRFAFFGTPSVARDTLDILHAAAIVPAVIVTNPDAPRGRGGVSSPSETKEWALAHNIPVLTPARLDANVIKEIEALGCDIALVVAYGKIFPSTLIEAFPKGAINVHYSLLPQYRGAAPVETALLNNEHTTGVTIQQMASALDAGDILMQEEEEIMPTDTAPVLRARLVARGARMLIELFPRLATGTITATPQNHSLATFAPKLSKEHAEIDPNGSAANNWNTYRAYKGWSGVHFFVKDRDGAKKRVKITDAAQGPEGEFVILRVIPEGKKEMDYATFVTQQAS